MTTNEITDTSRIFTGLRPTGDLTLGNYLGAIKPMIDLQSQHGHITMFVADLHGLTDQEPSTVAENRHTIAADYIALGLNPENATIFVQSDIKEQVLYLSMLLSRHMSMAEIMRVPTLKDKLKNPDHPEQATVMLANYPLMMAADILLNEATHVPVGEDQTSHIEVARLLARRFNSRYGDTLVEPNVVLVEGKKIMALNGDGKMSKSKPNGAILLSDSREQATAKIKKAETALEGEMNDTLQSHINVVAELGNDDQNQQLNDIVASHKAGEKVMGQFKELFAAVVGDFLDEYHQKRSEILNDMSRVEQLLQAGDETARQQANSVIEKVDSALGIA